MKGFLLSVFVLVSCLPSDKRNNSVTKNDESADNRESQESQESFYYKYRYGGSVDFAVKIDLARDGKLINLQTINLSTDTSINSIPLQRPQYTAGQGQGLLYYGDSYRAAGGEYSVTVDRKTASVNDLLNNPPKIIFTSFLRKGETAQGRAIERLTANQWQRLARQRPKAPSVTEPSPLPRRLSRWFENDFNVNTSGLVDSKYLSKLPRKRAITIDGNTYYGTVYQIYDGEKKCFGQLWGLDDVEVVQFLYDLGNKITLTTRDYKGYQYTTISGNGDKDWLFSCVDGVTKDQGVFRVIRNRLAIIEANGSINGYVDAQGIMHNGNPYR